MTSFKPYLLRQFGIGVRSLAHIVSDHYLNTCKLSGGPRILSIQGVSIFAFRGIKGGPGSFNLAFKGVRKSIIPNHTVVGIYIYVLKQPSP